MQVEDDESFAVRITRNDGRADVWLGRMTPSPIAGEGAQHWEPELPLAQPTLEPVSTADGQYSLAGHVGLVGQLKTANVRYTMGSKNDLHIDGTSMNFETTMAMHNVYEGMVDGIVRDIGSSTRNETFGFTVASVNPSLPTGTALHWQWVLISLGSYKASEDILRPSGTDGSRTVQTDVRAMYRIDRVELQSDCQTQIILSEDPYIESRTHDSEAVEWVELRSPGRHFTGPTERSFRIVTSSTEFDRIAGQWDALPFPFCPTACGFEAVVHTRQVRCIDPAGSEIDDNVCLARSASPSTELSCQSTAECGLVQFLKITPSTSGTHLRSMKEIEIFRHGVVPDAPLGSKSTNAMELEAGIWEFQASRSYEWTLVAGSQSSFVSPVSARGDVSWGSPGLLLDGLIVGDKSNPSGTVRLAPSDMNDDGLLECDLTIDLGEPTAIDTVRFAGAMFPTSALHPHFMDTEGSSTKTCSGVFSDLQISLYNADQFGNPTVVAGNCHVQQNIDWNGEASCYELTVNMTDGDTATEAADVEPYDDSSLIADSFTGTSQSTSHSTFVSPCDGHGTCTSLESGRAVCECNSGYQGSRCTHRNESSVILTLTEFCESLGLYSCAEDQSSCQFSACDFQYNEEAAVNATESTPCNEHDCMTPIDCRGEWSEWSECSHPCGGSGTTRRSYRIIASAAHGGRNDTCSNDVEEAAACNIAPCPAPTLCRWSDWSVCSSECGGGTRTRTFLQLSSTSAANGEACEHAIVNATESTPCNEHDCMTPIDCRGEWSEWSECSHPCGGSGTTRRSYRIIASAAHGGRNDTCSNDVEEAAACNTGPCPIDCAGHWSEFSACSSECGGGFQTRTYNVDVQAEYGGSLLTCDASSADVDIRACSKHPCDEATALINGATILQLTLDTDIQSVFTENQERKEFETAFARDVAAELGGIDVRRIVINAIYPGEVQFIVDLTSINTHMNDR
eukprot:SAG31_NODE_107_length_24865_cov_17.973593_12_plen_964_part_00